MSTMTTHIGSLALQVFPRLASQEITVMGTIANEGKPLSGYALGKLSKSNSELPAYSTIHQKLISLMRRSFLDATLGKKDSRTVISYDLTFKGLLASLASPLVNASNVVLERVMTDVAKKLYIPKHQTKGVQFILSVWLYGLSKTGIDLESQELGLTFFEDTLSFTIFHLLGLTSRLRGCSVINLIEEISDKQNDEARNAFKSFLADFIQHEWLATYSRIGYVFINSDLGWKPALIGSFLIANDPAVSLTIQVGVPRIPDALVEILDLGPRGQLNAMNTLQILKEHTEFFALPPSYLCSAMCFDGTCRKTNTRCIAADNRDAIWRCPHLKFVQPDKVRKMFGKITIDGKEIGDFADKKKPVN
jgi:hypothetical protein